LLGQSVVFTAGIAEAKSKGRGEECISQNLRILRAKNGRQVILFFTNSQRKEKKRYITIPREYSRHPPIGTTLSKIGRRLLYMTLTRE
jgi:cobalamin biosynthesis protein CbiD